MTKIHKNFTLLELLIVVAVIAILISLLLPALGKARRSAQGLVCLNTLKSIGTAHSMYADAYDDYPIAQYVLDPSGGSQIIWLAWLSSILNNSLRKSPPWAFRNFCPLKPDSYAGHMNTSYGLNPYLISKKDSGGWLPDTPYRPYFKRTSIRIPSIAVVSGDMSASNGQYEYLDNIGFYHGSGFKPSGLTNHLFLDGHVQAMSYFALQKKNPYFGYLAIPAQWH